MKSFSSRRHAMAGVFVFMLLAAFAVFSTLLVLLGARAYSAVVNRSERANQERILVNYPLSKVRAGTLYGAVEVRETDGLSMLVISQELGEEMYETRIYCYDGWLREMFVSREAARDFTLEDGDPLARAEYFRPSISEGFLSFEVGADEAYQGSWRLRVQ